MSQWTSVPPAGFVPYSLCIPSSYSLGNFYSWLFEANFFCCEVLPVWFWVSHFQQAPKPPVKSLVLVRKSFLGYHKEFLEKEGARYVPAIFFFNMDKNRSGEGEPEGIITFGCRDTMPTSAWIPGATLAENSLQDEGKECSHEEPQVSLGPCKHPKMLLQTFHPSPDSPRNTAC